MGERSLDRLVDPSTAQQDGRRLDLAGGSEVVAEVFAALLLGRDDLRQVEETMRLYEKYGGSDIRQYDCGN